MILNELTAKKRQFALVAIMMTVTLFAIFVVISSLYIASIEQEKQDLVSLVRSQVSLIESVTEFDSEYSTGDRPGGAREATIGQLIKAYDKNNIFGKTGEFVLGSIENGQARFLYKSHTKYSERLQEEMLSHSTDKDSHATAKSELVVMTHALHGETGVISAKDYEFIDVLAAYTWIDSLKVGLVAKIDVAEIREPFVKAALLALVLCIPAVLLGYFLFMKLSGRFLSDLESQKERLVAANEINRNVFMLSPIGMALYDQNGDCLEANEAVTRIVGASRGQVLEQNYNEIESWKNSGLLAMAKKTVAENHSQHQEFTLTTTFGKYLTVNAHMVMFGSGSGSGKYHLLLLLEDISERMGVLSALARSEETFAKAQEIVHIGSWDWDIVSDELKWSDEIYRIFGLNPQEFGATYDEFINYIHPDDRQAVIEAVNVCMDDINAPYKIEHRIIRSSGEERIVMEQGKVYRDKDNKPVRMIGTVHDVTEQKRAGEVLKDSEERLRMAMSAAEIGTWKWDIVTNQDTRDANFNRILGLEAAESTQSLDDFVERVHPDDRAAVDQELKRSMRERDTYLAEFRIVRPDGIERWLRDQGLPYYDEQNIISYMTGAVVDITERKQAEAELDRYRDHLEELVEERTQDLKSAQSELVRKERLAALGQLTATVSHELRNPLGAMRPSLYLIRKKIGLKDDQLVQAIERIDRNVMRCDHIIDELLDFTRITDMDLETVVLDDWLMGILSEQSVHSDIRFIQKLSLGDYRAEIDVNRLRRVVVNVIENACHAMQEDDNPDKVRPDSQLTVDTAREGGRIEIRVQDTGTGIPEDVLPKIFEPLYSTKSFGVGLGMSIIKQIMEQHGGGVEVMSKKNKGTTVMLWITQDKEGSRRPA